MFGVVLLEFGRMWWIFLLSCLLVGLIKGYKLDLIIRNAVRRSGLVGILIAIGVGMVSPLCACGILPVVISLAMIGTPLPPLLAILATSPTMGPDALLLTWSWLGPEWAVLKVIGSGLLGLAVGLAARWLVGPDGDGEELLLQPVFREDGNLASAAEIGAAAGIRVKSMTIVPRASRLRFIADRSLDAAKFTGKYLVLAVLLEAVIVTLVPAEWIATLLGGRGVSSVLVAAVIGLPLPTNQIPLIPILNGLLQRGIDHGAALTLLLAGPVSSLPAIIALAGMFRKRVLALFLGVSLLVSVSLGYLYQLSQ